MNHNRIEKNRIAGARCKVGLIAVGLIVFAAGCVASAQEQNDALNFKGGIGVINVIGQNPDLTLKFNVVRGVNPAGPWRIAGLNASVGFDGHITVIGRGLLLANGNNIATNAGASVHATLFCGAATTATAFDEPGVPLDAAGNFRIDDFLSSVPPTPCMSPVLLIRNGAAPGQGVWFAAGIPQLDTGNEKD